jgi:hypothetical protein
MGKKAPNSTPQMNLAEKVSFSKEIESIISEGIPESVEEILKEIPVDGKLLKSAQQPKTAEIQQNLKAKILMVICEKGEKWELVSHSQCAFPKDISEDSSLAQYLLALPDEDLTSLRFLIMIGQQTREKTMYIINESNRAKFLDKIADMAQIRRPRPPVRRGGKSSRNGGYEPHVYRVRLP